MFAQLVSGDRLNLGLRELAILAFVLVLVALFTKPEAVLNHLRNLAGGVLPFLKPAPLQDVTPEPFEFLELHAALTELSLSQGGLYNKPLADMYSLYLKNGIEEVTDAD